MQMAESKIKTFLSLGSLQREILEEARRYECLGQALEHDEPDAEAHYFRLPLLVSSPLRLHQ